MSQFPRPVMQEIGRSPDDPANDRFNLPPERRKGGGVRCPRVEFECGHVAFIWPEEYGDGSAWCQACGAFRCYDRCPRCLAFDCDHRESA